MTGATEAMLRLAGCALAHAIWSVEDGETLIPMAMIASNGEVDLVRYEADTLEASVDAAYESLGKRLLGDDLAALVFDSYATSPDSQRTDALVVELLLSGGQRAGAVIQRYRPPGTLADGLRPFELLGDPLVAEPFDIDDPDEAVRAIKAGAREHSEGPRLFPA
jgi:hypothetical protein